MAWKPQGGGPWGGGGGGGGPWGGGGYGGGSGGPADFEDALKQAQERMKRFLPGGFGAPRGIILAVIAVLAIWLASGFYRVQPGEVGVQLLFGKYVSRTTPGLNYWFPGPIGDVIKPNVERTNTIAIGYRGDSDRKRDVATESLMLTSDQNIVDIDFVVQWRIKDAAEFLFNIRDPENTIKLAAESAIREVIGQTPLEGALTNQRFQVQGQTKDLLQKILDEYKAGVFVTEVQLQEVDPPKDVIDAFNDVQRAKQDQERSINEATAYNNNVVPRARGEGEKMVADASAYRERVIKEAEGEAARFLSVYETYKLAKDVTTRRLFLEKMEEVLKGSEKIIIDKGAGGTGVVPYLPLPELKKKSTGASK